MANTDDSQLNEESNARTYGAKDIHKRRVDRKSRPKPSRPATTPEPEELEPKRDATRTRFTDMPGLLPETDDETPTSDTPQMPESEDAGDAPETAKTSRLAQLRAKIPSPLATAQPSQEENATEAASDAPSQSDEQTPEPSAGDEVASPSPRKRKDAPKKPPRHPKLRIVLPVIAVVAAIALVLGGLFAWNRWYRFDDHADMQGEWYVAGTAVPITIDSSAINLTPEVTYDYALNDHDKTISYTFGPMQGHGTYWFSGDRQYLVIVDDNSAAAQELPNDAISQTLRSLGDTKASDLPKGDGVIAFNRKPAPLAKAEQSIASRVLSEKAAKEAQEQREAEEQAAAEAAEQGGYYGYYYY